MEIKEIQEKLMKGELNTNPHGCAEAHAFLAGHYSWIMGQLEGVLQRKPAIWNELRKTASSDTACERMWEATKDGLDEAGLRLRAKGIEKMMSSLKSLLRLAEGEEGFKKA